MFNSIPVSPLVPSRRASRRQHLAARLATLAEILVRHPERFDEPHAPQDQLADLRHRILSRYY